MTAHPPAIVLGIDTPIGVTVIRELGRHGVPVHGIGRTAYAIGAASRYCTSASVRPKNIPLDQWLPDLIAATGATALLAISEDDLIALSDLPETINGCRILTPRRAPLDIVLDKTATLAAAAALGIDVPASWHPQSSDDFATKAETLTYPVVAKWPDPPRVVARLADAGLPLVKAEFIDGPAALRDLLARYAPVGQWPLIQQYCPGNGLGQMLHIAADGTATLRFQHRRLHEWPPEGGVSTLCVAEPLTRHQSQMAQSEALLNAIGWHGPAMVEYRHDPATGRYWLMEINGRFWGSIPLASHSGAEFAWETYRRAVLKDLTPAPEWRAGIRARYMIPETRRLIRLLIQRDRIADPYFKPTPWRDMRDYLCGLFDPRMRYYLWSWRDPGPLLADLRAIIRKVVRRGNP